MLHDAKMKSVPVLFIRFEDLVRNPKEELENIMKFLCNTKDIKGTNAERRIQEVLAKGEDATVTYQLKDHTRVLNPNVKKYNLEQLEFIKKELKDIIYYFGYAFMADDPDNITGFFEYENAEPELVKTYYGFKELNNHSIGWNAYMSDEERALIQLKNSDPEKRVGVLDEGDEWSRLDSCLIHDTELRMFGKTNQKV